MPDYTFFRIGHGYDVHRLCEGRRLVIGGVDIPHTVGLLGHSDADVLLHAIIDAVLGALALGDIGHSFPDTDEKYKDIDSTILAKSTADLMLEKGYVIGNIDSTVIAQYPKLVSFFMWTLYIIRDLVKAVLGFKNKESKEEVEAC